MGRNEQLKADLSTGWTKFASAATELQTLTDVIDQVAKNLSPAEQKWVGAASSHCQETLRAFDEACLDALRTLGDTAFAEKRDATGDHRRRGRSAERSQEGGDRQSRDPGVGSDVFASGRRCNRGIIDKKKRKHNKKRL